MKTLLQNGCSHADLTVTPKNWKTKKASTSLNWFIKYRFYDSRYPQPKQVMIKGMNAFKKLSERQEETRKLLEKEQEALKNGFNPFNNENAPINDSLSFIEALHSACGMLNVAPTTLRDIKSAIIKFENAVEALGWNHLPITDISRKHVRFILDKSSNSDDRFNKNRSYLMILFSVLCEIEVIQSNFVKDIKKRKTVKKIRAVLSNEERRQVDTYLKENHPEFHRFLHIFFHSGARITEMMRVKISDIEVNNHRFKVLIKKGSNYHEVWKTIKTIALPYWEDVLKSGHKDQFAFSNGLNPGNKAIEPYQITKRWYRLVKKKLGINADFYALNGTNSRYSII